VTVTPARTAETPDGTSNARPAPRASITVVRAPELDEPVKLTPKTMSFPSAIGPRVRR
jgi:hypothetical protein